MSSRSCTEFKHKSNKSSNMFGKYNLITRLDKGGMAEIFLASTSRFAGFEKMIVIKRMLPHLSCKREFVQLFLDEASITAKFNHPNVIQNFDLGVIDDQYFMAMEYLEGESLFTLVKTCIKLHGRLPAELAAGIVMQAANGLHYVHTFSEHGRPLNIVHRDISLKNIFVLYDGVVKLVDFGVARVSSRDSKTAVGTIKGKPSYMSPEQIIGKEIDGRSDIFSLGVVLWECLVGKNLFRSKNQLDLLRTIIEKDAPSPRQFVTSIPAELESIVMRALSRNRAVRYQSSREFYDDLSQFILKSSNPVDSRTISGLMQSLFSARILERRRLIENSCRLRNSATPSEVEQHSTNPIFQMSGRKSSQANSGSKSPQFRSPYRTQTAVFLISILAALLVLVFVFVEKSTGPAINKILERIKAPNLPLVVRSVTNPHDGRVLINDAKRYKPVPSIKKGFRATGEQLYLVEAIRTKSMRRRKSGTLKTRRNSFLAENRFQLSTTDLFVKEEGHNAIQNSKRVVDSRLAAIAVTRPKTPGRLRLITIPWTEIYQNGHKLGQTPLIDVELPSGWVTLRAVNQKAHLDKTITVEIKPGTCVKKRFSFFSPL